MLYTCSQCGTAIESDERPFGWLRLVDDDYFDEEKRNAGYICDECNVKKFYPVIDALHNSGRDVVDHPTAEPDVVNHPPHYTHGDVECIDAIRASMTYDEFAGYLKGNSIKYLWRYRDKGNEVQDLEKCLWYVEKLKQVTEERSS